MSSATSSAGSGVLATLKQKILNLRDELDKYKDMYEEKCREVQAERLRFDEAENEVQSLRRRNLLLEEERDQLETRLRSSADKLLEASKVVDAFERTQRTLDNRLKMDDEKISQLEEQLTHFKTASAEIERKYEEVARRLIVTETELEKAEDRAEVAEAKVRHLDSDLQLVSTSLKSLEVNEQKLARLEEQCEMKELELSTRLRNAERTIELLSHELKCKQADLERTEQRLLESELQCKDLREELETCFRDIRNM